MVEQGLVLMAAGMGVVFVFLLTMVIAMNIAAAFFRKYGHHFKDDEPVTEAKPVAPAPVAPVAPQVQPTQPTADQSAVAPQDDSVEIAVAIAAVQAYMRN